ncbi:MAG TPA: uroporphyrinogen-III C-methyltransferase [Gammaproteobacteria bacterium]|jgi:uncharacterized protein HemX|nr:uroporphyrinogen-III C-methyltransferase [Gammaproteobacteria bacterium]
MTEKENKKSYLVGIIAWLLLLIMITGMGLFAYTEFMRDRSAAMQRMDQTKQQMQGDIAQLQKAVEKNENLLMQQADIIAKWRTVQQEDIDALYAQIAALDKQLDQLPFSPTPLTSTIVPTIQIDPHLPWWKAGLLRLWQALQQIMIVRRDDNHQIALVVPEDKPLIYQNLHAKVESIIWAVLHHNSMVYSDSLDRLSVWIEQYFDKTAPYTQSVLSNIARLKAITIHQ